MRKLSCLISGVAALTLLGCPSIDPGDPFDSLTTVSNDDTTGDGDGDQTGDGDGDQTGDGDGDQTGDGDGDQTGDGDGDGTCGSFGAACSGDTCCEGLSCQANGTCGISGGDGDGDGDGDTPMWGAGPYYGAPPNCQPDEVPLMAGQLPVPGGHCSPIAMCTDAQCSNMDACPPAPANSTAIGTILWADNMMNNYCGLLCMVAADPDQCPPGSSCKDLSNPQAPGYGACTYP